MLEELQKDITQIKSKDELDEVLSRLKILASNRRSDKIVIMIIKNCINVANQFKDFKSRVILEGLLILQFIQQPDQLERSEKLLNKMQSLARKIRYKEGLAFSSSFSWYLAKMKGKDEEGRNEIHKAIDLIEQTFQPDRFIFHFIKYTYAIEIWLSKKDIRAIEILENCFIYFFENKLYHSLIMSLGILIIIFQQTQNKEESMKLIRKILRKRDLLLEIPQEIRSNIYFFIGFIHELNFNLGEAEKHLLEAKEMLKPIYKTSIYSGYYITALSYLTSTFALQGKLELALRQMREVEELIEEGIATKNLDSFNKNQLKHIFYFTKFYIYSRLQNFQVEDLHELVQSILNNIDKYQSNAMFFSEFLLNANLTKEQLTEIKNLNNSSTRRVEHIINFLIEKETDMDEKQIMRSISSLKRRTVEDRMTFTEKAFADLLAAKEYYKIKRFAEISPLLRKYENNLHKIEVLEMRVFMEAFIQVGAYKNGDPLGPALQYMAIKKCRKYGFSRLEDNLLNYLSMQRNDALLSLA